MARPDPLLTVLKLATDAEEQAGMQLRAAQMECQKRDAQQQALQNYRLDYMKQMSMQQGQNISASAYHQFHRFVQQIDDAIAQQIKACAEADNQRQHRQTHWLEKQKKRKAVELLLEHKAEKKAVKAQKAEQKMFDEFASQQFFRKRSIR
ncbi:flagellar export protein FliJ [Shewanella gelidii]|uniref:Flagellar FliJ protein n=1 Tax=Shewanella gelidii TaxID=1642821 RepID=A0A917JJM6_9GAMM|nr:flagellar export protein FliJ [Shewanella gelidii]MCL1096461.1 flagellar export protein FliJ [Shewanella gelidii]GGI67511.1 flagellar export protein FliJ [Shewanella gelidii]